MSRLRELPGLQILIALAAVTVVGVAVLSLVTDLPGAGLRERLGLGSSEFAPCTPDPQLVREPPGGPAPERPGWRREPALPLPRDEAKSVLRGDEIWLASGAVPGDDTLRSLRDVTAFDPATRSYVAQPPLPQPLDHVAMGAYRGDVLVAGGYTATRASSRAWRYLAAERRWEAVAPLDRPRAAPGSAMLGSRLYVAGGIAVSSFARDILERMPERSMVVYDFETGKWSAAAQMSVPRHHFALVAHRGALYAIGGRTAGDFSTDAVERYDPGRDEWTTLEPMPQGVGGPGADSAGDRIVVAGGGDDAERWITPAAWSFDPERGRWERLADLGEPRHGLTLTIAGGRAYAFGGSPCPGFGVARTVESLTVTGR